MQFLFIKMKTWNSFEIVYLNGHHHGFVDETSLTSDIGATDSIGWGCTVRSTNDWFTWSCKLLTEMKFVRGLKIFAKKRTQNTSGNQRLHSFFLSYFRCDWYNLRSNCIGLFWFWRCTWLNQLRVQIVDWNEFRLNTKNLCKRNKIPWAFKRFSCKFLFRGRLFDTFCCCCCHCCLRPIDFFCDAGSSALTIGDCCGNWPFNNGCWWGCTIIGNCCWGCKMYGW